MAPVKQEVLNAAHVPYVYELLKANAVRGRQVMTMVLFACNSKSSQDAETVLGGLIRSTDVLFETGMPEEWGLLLPMSGADEAKGFLGRLFRETDQARAAVLEIVHPDMELLPSLERMRMELQGADGQRVVEVNIGLPRPVETVKVSVLDPDPIFRDVLGTALNQLQMSGITLEVQTFADGRLFLESGWTVSAHPHVVVMNDLLPRQNGLDVLHALRLLPNDGKFTILMMTRRNSEEDMTYAYESGADGYLVKPFNLRLFEAQVKRLLARVWS